MIHKTNNILHVASLGLFPSKSRNTKHSRDSRHNFDVNFRVKASGMTPLMEDGTLAVVSCGFTAKFLVCEATRFGHIFGVELLMELRADPHCVNKSGHSALDIAKAKVPEYLDFQEMQCSENRRQLVEECIERDRKRIAQLLSCP